MGLELLPYLKRRYPQTYNLIKKFEPKLEWEDLNSDCILDFKKFLLTESVKVNGEPYSSNTFVKHYNYLRSSVKKNRPELYLEMSNIRVKKEEVQHIYLTKEELLQLEKVKLRYGNESNVRDLFLIGAYTGARYSDFSQFSIDNVQNGVLYYMAQKTGALVKVPVHPFVMNKLKTGLPKMNYKNESSQLAALDRTIKVVCKKAGINEKGIYFKKQHGRVTNQVKPKYMKVSSHTARRSFATNLHLEGADILYIKELLGHKDVTSTQRYILSGISEMVEKAKGFDFFNPG